MTTIAPAGLVQGAARAPLPYGLFSTFTLRTGDRWENGVAWETLDCGPAQGFGQLSCGTSVVPGTAEVQQVTITGTPTGGTFTLLVRGVPTAPIVYNATAAQVQTALRAQPNTSGVTVTGGPGPGTPWTVTWPATGDQGALTGSATGLTGGTSPAVGVTTTTQGVADTPAGGMTGVGLPLDLDGNVGGFGAALPFTVYGHFSCSPVGFSLNAAATLASAHLMAREEARAEQALWTGDLGNTPFLADPATDTLAGGTATDPVASLSLLEDYLAANYGSQGVIHLTRGFALQALSLDLLETTGNGTRLVTKLGTPVAAGAGYPGTAPGGAAAGPNTTWAYASPALFGYRSEVFTSDSNPGDLFDHGHNVLTAIAERSYLLGFDPCGVGAVKVATVAP